MNDSQCRLGSFSRVVDPISNEYDRGLWFPETAAIFELSLGAKGLVAG